jgi:hypothetical protein
VSEFGLARMNDPVASLAQRELSIVTLALSRWTP